MASKVTHTQRIYEALTDDIVQSRLRPGDTLDEVRLAATFGVSRTPVREALRKLEIAGFAEARPHRGTVVASISAQKLDEMFIVMAGLESLCAYWAALNMTPLERQALLLMHQTTESLVREGSVNDYKLANSAFHQAIYNGAHNAFLDELTQSVRLRVGPYRQAQFDTAGRLARSHEEHDRIVLAIQRGDANAAAAAMRVHLTVVRSEVDRLVEDLTFEHVTASDR